MNLRKDLTPKLSNIKQERASNYQKKGVAVKNCMSCLCIFLLAVSVSSAWGVGSIAGTVSYGGTQTGSVVVAAFDSPLSCSAPNPDPVAYTQLASPGSYELSGLTDGSYYIASIIMTCGTNCGPYRNDPWGIYNGCSDIKPVIVSGGTVNPVDITLGDGSKDNPNPFVKIVTNYYLGVTGNASGFVGFEKSFDELEYFGFSVPGDGGGSLSGVEAIVPFGGHQSPLKYLQPEVGQTWTDTGDSNGYRIDSVSTVLSVSAAVTVSAGSFSNCAHVRESLTWPDGHDPDQPTYWVQFDRWLCPGIGPARLIVTDNWGGTYPGQLMSYNISSINPSDYFPLELGYQWTFRMDNDGRSATWTVNAIAPDVFIESKPANPSNQTSAIFSFSSTDITATFECKLDTSDYAVCSSPQNYTDLSVGAHKFSVRAKDTAGYVSVDPPSYSWNIFITPPVRIAGPSYYDFITDAYFALSEGVPAEMQVQAALLTEEVDFNKNIPLTLRGGFDPTFKINSGYTTLRGSLKITTGSLNVDRVIVK
jgi:hypothetical protein